MVMPIIFCNFVALKKQTTLSNEGKQCKSMKMIIDTTYDIKNKIVSIILLVMLFAVPKADAQTTQSTVPLYQLVLWYKDGSKADFLATAQPMFYFADDTIHFSTKSVTLKVPREEFDRFTLERVEPKWVFRIWLRDGGCVGYGIDEKPEVTLGDSLFTLTTQKHTVQYPAAQVLKFTLDDVAAFTDEDVNLDGFADTQDVLAIYEYMRTQKRRSPTIIYDVNHDGKVDSQDVLTIYSRINK